MSQIDLYYPVPKYLGLYPGVCHRIGANRRKRCDMKPSRDPFTPQLPHVLDASFSRVGENRGPRRSQWLRVCWEKSPRAGSNRRAHIKRALPFIVGPPLTCSHSPLCLSAGEARARCAIVSSHHHDSRKGVVTLRARHARCVPCVSGGG